MLDFSEIIFQLFIALQHILQCNIKRKKECQEKNGKNKITLKRYENRRIYNLEAKKYINFNEINEMIKKVLQLK